MTLLNERVFDPGDYGIQSLGLTYITSREYLNKEPDALGRFVKAALKGLEYSTQNREEALDKLRESISRDHFRDEFLNDVRPELAERIPPDLWELHWPLMNTPVRRQVAARRCRSDRTADQRSPTTAEGQTARRQRRRSAGGGRNGG